MTGAERVLSTAVVGMLLTVFAACAYTGWHLLHTSARLREGDRLLLHGAAGSIGTM